MKKKSQKMIVFDMDNTLLKRRFIDVCAEEYKFTQALGLLRQIDSDPVSLTVRISALLKGKKKSELLEIASSIEMIPDIRLVVNELKNDGYVVGIISDSYQLITEYVAKQIDADFWMGNELLYKGEVLTGSVLIPSYFHYSEESSCKHQVCKTNALRYITKKYSTDFSDCVVVGDSENDVCIVKHAGIGVAFCTTSDLLKEVATKHINRHSFQQLLDFTKISIG